MRRQRKRPTEEQPRAPARKRRPPVQLDLDFKGRGGARIGAGRKLVGPRPSVSHKTRPVHTACHPPMVTMRLHQNLPSLRRPEARAALHAVLGEVRERCERFRVVVFALQSNHIHLILEAQDGRELAQGMQRLSVRMARRLNRTWSRRGRVFGDRYHARALGTPHEVRIALVYVLHNARKHGVHGRGIDPYSSGLWFGGWEDPEGAAPPSASHPRTNDEAPAARSSTLPVAQPQSWLLSQGWLRLGRIGIDEAPGGKRQGRGRAKPL